MTDASYEYPQDYNFEKIYNKNFGIIKYAAFKVVVEFTGWAAKYVSERTWSPDQKIRKLKDGSIILTMTTSGWFDVRSWLLSFGADAELLEPVDKRDEIRKAVRELVDLYERRDRKTRGI